MVPPRYLIVGSGIAGLAAAEAMRRRIPLATIVMISEEVHDFYSRPGLAYLLRGDLPEKCLRVRSPEDLAALRLTRIHARAKEIHSETKEVVLSDGKRLSYDRLLLATGALAVPPAFPGAQLAGVVKLDGLDDARRILEAAGRGKTAVVTGGGITALELAEGLNARGMRIHYFLRGDRYWSDVLDDEESAIVMDRLRHEGIQLHLRTEIQHACGEREVTGVVTKTGEHVPCRMLAVAIGVRPRVDLARQAGLAVDRGIVVDRLMRTSRTDIFAAGDAAQVETTPLDVLWPTALDQGRIAGLNMTGEKASYVKGVACNVTMLAGLKVTIIGSVGRRKATDPDLVSIARGDSEAWRLQPVAHVLAGGSGVDRVRVFLAGNRIVGAVVMGEQAWSRPLQQLVGHQVDIGPIRQELTGDGSRGLEILGEFHRRWLNGADRTA